ncbi:hypothetical protein DFQ28_004042, partial [Apophysomyces sp. BC1034]
MLVKDFFSQQDVSNWTVLKYLMYLMQRNPTVTKRFAHQCVKNDVDIMNEFVLEGTVADTFLCQMNETLKKGDKNTALEEFWKRSSNIAQSVVNYEAEKLAFRTVLTSEVTLGQELLLGKRRRNSVDVQESSSNTVRRDVIEE